MSFSNCFDLCTTNHNFLTLQAERFRECVREHPPTSYRDIGALKKYLERLDYEIGVLYMAFEDEMYTPRESSDHLAYLWKQIEAREREYKEYSRIMKELEQSA